MAPKNNPELQEALRQKPLRFLFLRFWLWRHRKHEVIGTMERDTGNVEVTCAPCFSRYVDDSVHYMESDRHLNLSNHEGFFLIHN